MRRIVPTMLLGFFVMDLSFLILGLVIHLLCLCFRQEIESSYCSTLVNCVARVVSEAILRTLEDRPLATLAAPHLARLVRCVDQFNPTACCAATQTVQQLPLVVVVLTAHPEGVPLVPIRLFPPVVIGVVDLGFEVLVWIDDPTSFWSLVLRDIHG